jgi:gliding motility-associated-like protein
MHITTICAYDNPTPGFYWDPAQPTVTNTTIQFIDASKNAITYYYNFANLGSSSEANPVFEFEGIIQETTFEVCQTVTSSEGCSVDSCQILTIYDEVVFYIPNVFTPDHDDYNETFLPVFTSGFDPYDYHLIIFNRWGEVVFESYNTAIGWDGKYNGELCEDGVYVWQVEFGEILSDKVQQHRGHVTLLK